MKFISAAKLLLPASLLISSAQAAECDSDNCLRAMFPTASPTQLASVSAFCATYTQSANTATTSLPARFSSQCGSNPSRISSACSCRVTSAPCASATPGNLIINGGFECGIPPWTPAAVTGTTYAVTSPGYTGDFAFEVDQNITPVYTGLEQASINQDIPTTIGTAYVLTFNSWLNPGDAGFIGVKINQAAVYTVDAEDKLGPGVWNSNTIQFTATTASTNIRLEFLFGPAGSVDKVDDVAVTAM